MAYEAQISRANPSAIVLLVDQSGSMKNPFGRQPDKRKADGVAEIINDLLYNLTIQCTKSAGIHDFLQLGIVGYGLAVGSAFKGNLAGRSLVRVGELANNPLRIQERSWVEKDFAGQDVVKKTKRPIWVEPEANGKTPLAEALTLAAQWLREFLGQFPGCFPPLVINLTDGMPSAEPRPQARALCELQSQDGRVLLFNVHLSEQAAAPVEFPSREDGLPDNFAKLLFRISSVLPPKYVGMARAAGMPVEDQSRGFVFNADFVAVHKFLDFGTKTQQTNPGASR